MSNPAGSTSLFPTAGSKQDLEMGTTLAPRFDKDGLIAGLATDAETGEVLMLAWMNAESLTKSIETGVAHFWSRSRGELWRKGETSGNELRIVEMLTDCDQDAILMRVKIAGNGVACHTGARSCFYRKVALGAPAATAGLSRLDEDAT